MNPLIKITQRPNVELQKERFGGLNHSMKQIFHIENIFDQASLVH